MTNYEAIKAMGMNELAGFLASITTCFDCPARNCGGHEVCTAAGADVLITAITRRGTVQVFRAAWNAEMGLWQGGGVIRQKC